ncbi:MAG: hypothetical protein KC635_24200 [Myxococcales bacterium]|nr:hypothetical protein [Myxococcales bacterium]
MSRRQRRPGRGPRGLVAPLFLAALALSPPAAALSPDTPLTQLSTSSWGRREGLPTEAIGDVEVASDGTIWLATDVGVVTLDGAEVRHFNVANTPELPSDAVVELCADGPRVWIGTVRGLAWWEAGAFHRVDPA